MSKFRRDIKLERHSIQFWTCRPFGANPDLHCASSCGNKVTGAIWWHNGKLQCYSELLTFSNCDFLTCILIYKKRWRSTKSIKVYISGGAERSSGKTPVQPSHFLEEVPGGVAGKEGMGKFSPVFPMTWVLFKEGARSDGESVSGGSAERTAEPQCRGPG